MITLLLFGSAVLIYFWGILSLYLWFVFSLLGDSLAYGIASFSGDFRMWWYVYHYITPPFLRSFFHTAHSFSQSHSFPPGCGIARPLVLRRSSICIARKLSIWLLDLRRNNTRWATVLWSGKSGDVTSSNRDHMPWLLYYCLGRLSLYSLEVSCVLYLWFMSLYQDSLACGIASFSGDFRMWWYVYHYSGSKLVTRWSSSVFSGLAG